jgi:hypothetical protein
VSGTQVQLSNIPVVSGALTDDTISRKIYRSSGGAYVLVGTLGDNTTTILTDNTASGSGAPAQSAVYIDVTFNATPGATLDYGSILDSGDEFTVSGAAATGLTFSGTPTPIAFVQDPDTGALVTTPLRQQTGETTDAWYARLAAAGVKTFRYTATSTTGNWSTGELDIAFTAGWQDSLGNAGATDAKYNRQITVNGPTARIADPQGGSTIDVNVLNGRNYIDVTLPDAPTGYSIAPESVTSRPATFS